MTESATEFQLKLLRWQFFCTFTWRTSKLGSVASRERDLWQFLRAESLLRGIRLVQLQAAVRWERGELGERPHAHALLAGFPSAKVNPSNGYALAAAWAKQYGHAKVSVVDHGQASNIVAYLIPEDGGHGHRYELRKYDRADRMTVSTAAWTAMHRAAGVLADVPQLR